MRETPALALALALVLAGCDFTVRGLPSTGTDASVPATQADLSTGATPPSDLLGTPAFTPRVSGTGENLTAVWGTGATDVFVVGEKGTLLRSTDHGATWQAANLSTTSTLSGLWGPSTGNVYACGDNAILRHTTDGTSWNGPATLTGNGHAMWGSSAADLWIVGSGYRLQHSTDGAGTSWNEIQPIGNSDSFYGIWGSGPSDLFVVGIHKIIHSTDGMMWTTQYDGPAMLYGVTGGNGQSLAVGASGAILRYTSGQWMQQPSGTTETLRAVWTGGGETWVVGTRGTILQSTNGTSYQPMVSGTSVDLHGIWGASANDLYVVGDGGTILHRP